MQYSCCAVQLLGWLCSPMGRGCGGGRALLTEPMWSDWWTTYPMCQVQALGIARWCVFVWAVVVVQAEACMLQCNRCMKHVWSCLGALAEGAMWAAGAAGCMVLDVLETAAAAASAAGFMRHAKGAGGRLPVPSPLGARTVAVGVVVQSFLSTYPWVCTHPFLKSCSEWCTSCRCNQEPRLSVGCVC